VAATTEPAQPSTGHDSPYGIAPRLALAALSLSAGVVHLVFVPAHISEWTLEGVAFAVVGWLQILMAIGLLMRPSRGLLQGTVVLNAAIVVAYIISRTSGFPFGPESGIAEATGSIDLLTTVFEGLLVVGAGVLLARPRFLADLSTDALVIASAIPVVALIATTVALADPATSEHHHDDGTGAETVSADGHTHSHGTTSAGTADLASIASNRCDLGLNPAAYWTETTTAGVDTITGGESDVHDHNAAAQVQGSPELDQLISKQTTGTGEAGDAAMVVALGKVSDAVYQDWLRWLAASGTAGHSHDTSTATTTANSAAPDDNHGMGGHLGPQPWHAMTDQTQCEQLSSEIALARDTALRYPTPKEGKAAGYVQVTPYVPGIGAHYMNFKYVDDKFSITEPEMVLYDGTTDDAHVIGLSYYIIHPGSAEPTQGFTGNNDHFHRHDGLCVGKGGVIGDSTTTAEECAARGGVKANGQAGWMSHAWVVPGCESPWGVFSGATPVLDAGLGQNSGKDGGGCAGSGVRARYDLSPGDVSNTPTTVGGTVELASGG
jgi:hypothetical protein